MAEDLSPSAGKIRVKITCPLSVVADMEADRVLIPALGGDFLVMPQKAPQFFLMREGKVVIQRQDMADKVYWVSKGVCEVRRDICAVMAWAEEKTGVSLDKIRSELERGEKLLTTLPAGKAAWAIQNRLGFYRLILKEVTSSSD